LTAEERAELERVSRSGSDRADRVAHAKALLAIADGDRFSDAARCAGRRSPRAVAYLVARFNARGLAALDRRHGGGQPSSMGASNGSASCESFIVPPTGNGMPPPPGR
jgi:hypothetical protein